MVLSAMLGGFGTWPGDDGLCTLETIYFTVEPLGSMRMKDPTHWHGVAAFVVTGVIASVLAEGLKRSNAQLADNQRKTTPSWRASRTASTRLIASGDIPTSTQRRPGWWASRRKNCWVRACGNCGRRPRIRLLADLPPRGGRERAGVGRGRSIPNRSTRGSKCDVIRHRTAWRYSSPTPPSGGRPNSGCGCMRVGDPADQ